ncbi:hypothetical protein AB0H76_08405 [Nocardia sp. NPDC050712]|uniref:hypothetical protein n=1 Tax=Nocardia sp. NPDC050712 TaxID=3155518 RepID=UPI0033C541E1
MAVLCPAPAESMPLRSSPEVDSAADVAEPWPSGLPCVRARRVGTALDFYLSLGCEVRLAADGWVVLGLGTTLFVLARRAESAHSG